MKEAKRAAKQVFERGDLVTDAEYTGIVLGGVIDREDGHGEYTVIDPSGRIMGIPAHQITEGLSVRNAKVFDLDGDNPLALANSLAGMVGGERSAALSLPQVDDARSYLGHLSAFVKRNGRAGTALVKAFASFDRQRERDGGPVWGCCFAAFNAWGAIGEKEQRRILNGWPPQNKFPTVRGVLAEIHQQSSTESAVRAVTFERAAGGDGVVAFSENVLTHGVTTPVVITIREGTRKADAIRIVEAALAAVQSSWDEIVSITAGGFKEYPAHAESPEKKPRTGRLNARKLGGKERKNMSAAAR